MLTLSVIIVLLAMSTFGYWYGLSGIRTMARASDGPRPHSRPGYYGTYVALWCAIPGLMILCLWLVLEPMIVRTVVVGGLPEAVRDQPAEIVGLVVNQIRNLAVGNITAATVEPHIVAAAEHWNRLSGFGEIAMIAVVFAIAALGLSFGRQSVAPRLRARNRVEQVIKIALIICSTVAIMTTVGIVLSMLFEAINFFTQVSPFNFFLGLTWDPRFVGAGGGGDVGQFGLLPLLWGTLFISAIALLVAVPIGLFSAIYLSEYAGPKLRSTAKPLIEILAGIPTVVYGFFALITVGPFFRDLGQTIGLSVAANSALTAGVVMGIMIIPFVSSLSDDIINAVPQSLRDGAYGLGSTKSETVRIVVLPAALPGIVGAILLAASRAIGETMIVVMAAGVAAKLTANPFEAVTTVTVKIVTQLTGDTEFTSPQTLVAFALGITLFAITLCLNIFALYIVRKYREQYE